ncbi:ABC transporter permease [Peterkaempfera bronchialis]|uniref:ABC transporter permease n=1 Tax=Peterkaempfera bronchialis TaxID=2126346 RepID=A0A345T4V5_9ACTN|nr:ABC transporter permease [Peterkaempfera bronchialis]AXI81010.1 ABC transporter permease [Peterkaempfera bronchialis]
MTTYIKGALLSYKALFTWLNPLGYVSSRIVRPIGLAIACVSLADYYGAAIGRMLIGASLLAGASAVIYGMALAVGNERSYGTLGTWLASPQNKLGAACQRALPHIADGVVGGLCTYLVCCALYGSLPIGVPAYTGLLSLAVVTTAGLGLALSALALLIEDLFIGPNVADLVLMMLTGTLIPHDRLPAFLQPLSEVLPVTHVMAAVAGRLAGGSWNGGEFLVELGVGAGWFAVSSLFMMWAVQRATHRLGRSSG